MLIRILPFRKNIKGTDPRSVLRSRDKSAAPVRTITQRFHPCAPRYPLYVKSALAMTGEIVNRDTRWLFPLRKCRGFA